MENNLSFNPNESKFLNLEIAKRDKTGKAEIIVFISDEEQLYSETICFQLNFI